MVDFFTSDLQKKKNTEIITFTPATNTNAANALTSAYTTFSQYVDCAPSMFNSQLVFVSVESGTQFRLQTYDPFLNAWTHNPASSATSSASAGIGRFTTVSCKGASGTATGGSTTSITTNLTIRKDLSGYFVRILSGPGAGQTRRISSVIGGANAIINVSTPFGTSITSSSVYQLYYPRVYVFKAVTTNGFQMYDWALDTWTTLTNPSAASTNEAIVWTTPNFNIDGEFVLVAESTSTGSNTTTTLNNTNKNWTVNQFSNFQIRITGGTGAGQIRTISSNTATAITVSAAWSVTPDNTSTYVIEGNEDYIYYVNSATNVARYSISGNTWTNLTPTGSKTLTTYTTNAAWVSNVPNSRWTSENTLINGRRAYVINNSVGASGIEYYDIAANTWNTVSNTTLITRAASGGNQFFEYKGQLYVMVLESLTTGIMNGPSQNSIGYGSIYKIDVDKESLNPCGSFTITPLLNISSLSFNNISNAKTIFPFIVKAGNVEKVYAYWGIPFSIEIIRVQVA